MTGKCLTKNLVYQDEVTTNDNNETKKYIGITANEFKQRYRNHSKSLCDVTIYSNETELSKYIWKFSGGFRVRQTRQATKVKRFD